MTDFLDRLAARALGGGSLLEPRLPSLFEPVASAPVVTPTLEMHDGTGRHPPTRTVAMAPTSKRDTGAAASTVPTAAASSFAPAANTLQRSRMDAIDPQSAAGSNDSVLRVTGSALPPPSHTRHQDVRRAGDAPPHDVRAPPTPPPRLSPERSRGTLLPPAAPVFVSSRGTNRTPASVHAAAGRTRMAAAVDPQRPAGEPMIHVSIGRLEVRAAPAAPRPPQHRAEARPSSLDDYLRQRGKAPS